MRGRAITYTQRTRLAIHATTSLTPDECLAVVEYAAASMLDGESPKRRRAVHVDRSRPNAAEVRLRVPPIRFERWTMLPQGPAGGPEVAWCARVVMRSGDGATHVRIGGMTEYWTLQPGVLTPWFALPGIRPVWRFSEYQELLWRVADRLRALDPDATVQTGIPDEALTTSDRVSELAERAARATPLAGLAAYVFVVLVVARELGLSPALMLAVGLLAMPFVRGARHHIASPARDYRDQPPPAPAARAGRAGRAVAALGAFAAVMALSIAGAIRLGHDPAILLVLGVLALPLVAAESRGRRGANRRS